MWRTIFGPAGHTDQIGGVAALSSKHGPAFGTTERSILKLLLE